MAAAGLLWALMAAMYAFRRSIAIPLCLFALLLGAGAMTWAVPDWYRHPRGAGTYARVSGVVADTPEEGASSIRVILRDVLAGPEDGPLMPLEGRVALTLYGGGAGIASQFAPGCRVTGPMTLAVPPAAQYAGGYDERLRLMLGGIRFESILNIGWAAIEKGDLPWWQTAVMGVRTRVGSAAERWIGEDRAAAICALLTGDAGSMPSSARDDFARLGISHLLAVSGLHVGILLMMVHALGRRCRWGAMTITLISAALLAFYFLLTGPRPSVLRATALWGVLTAGRIAGRAYSPPNSLAAVFVFILIARPLDFLDVGLQLSFLSAAGIVLLYPSLDALLLRRLRESAMPAPVRRPALYLLGLLLVTGCVFLATWPWMALYFGDLAPAAFAANLLFIPATTVILTLSIVFALLAVAWPPLSCPAAMLIAPMARWWLYLAEQAARRATVLALPSPPAAALALSGALTLALSPKAVRLRPRWRMLTVAALSAALIASCLPWTQYAGDDYSLRTAGDGSRTAVFLERDGVVLLLVMDKPVYHLSDALRAQGLRGPERLLFTGIDASDLRGVLEDEELMARTQGLVIPEPLAGDMNALTRELCILTPWETAAEGWRIESDGLGCQLVAFRGKSHGAKTRFAALLTQGERNALYIDPQYLTEGYAWASGLSAVVVARMTPARRERLALLTANAVIYTDGSGLALDKLTLLDGTCPVLYNMNDMGSVVLWDD
ncbi:MAG: ComEC family competence protein [Clostridiales bacterium]|nr:ComEC family competence protein [Clostridiales bacterium]